MKPKKIFRFLSFMELEQKISAMNVGMNSTLRAAKRVLRKDLAARLNNMTKEDIREQSRSVQQQVISSEWYKRSKTIAVYLAMEQELQTDLLISDLLNDPEKLCFVPVIDTTNDKLQMIRVYSQEDLDTFIPNRWGIPEPPPLLSSSLHRQVSSELDRLDLILTPGLGFEVETKNRIGRGKGYYDKFIQEAIKTNAVKGHPPPLTMGLALLPQLVSPGTIPLEEWDRKLDTIIFPLLSSS